MQAAGLITFVKTEKPDWSTLAKRLKWARDKRGLSQTQLAKAAGVAQGTIGNLESAERKSARKLVSIAAALQVQPAWLESGRGDWEAAKGAVFNALSTEERELLNHWRHLLGSDRRAKLRELAALAKEREAQRRELFEEAGVTKIAERAAAHSRELGATSTVEITDRLKQRELLEPEDHQR
jgi:transcriptional regulator with XRE-family HTH domain